MFGLSLKKAAPPAGAASSAAVSAMPMEFYGGANPVVTFKDVKKELNPPGTPTLSAAEKKRLDAATMVGSGDMLHPASLFSNWKVLALAGGGIVVVGIIVAGGYYWWASRQIVPAIPAPVVPETVVEVVPEPVATTTPEVIVSTTTSTELPVPARELELPSLLLPDGTDTDGEGLTDAEEELFRTDPAVADTDKDKYTDAHELYNLYDPAQAGPVKLLDAGVVREFDNPIFGYSFYYPASWALASVDSSYRTVLVSTVTGEYIEIKAFEKNRDTTFDDWLAALAPQERLDRLTPLETVHKEAALRRQDFLVYYFVTPTQVYALLYHPDGAVAVNYRSVIKMMARSFALGAGPLSVPERPPEEGVVPPPATTTPEAGTATTSGQL